MAVSTIDPNGLNIGQIGGTRNKIINGAMTIDQRNAGAAVTTYFDYPVDRFQVARGAGTEDATFSAQQDSDVPSGAGFTKSLKFTVTAAETSIGADERVDIRQRVEGFNVADFGFGAAGASSVTLSFWVRSSLTGTFGGSFQNSAANRSYPYTYTISAANTWEYKVVTVSGDTSGTWVKDSGNGLTIFWSLGAGSNRVGTSGAWNANNNTGATGQVQLISTSGATFYLTGFQLEAGDTATPFEHRSYGQELALCQRYFALAPVAGAAIANGTTTVDAPVAYPVQMRAGATITARAVVTVTDVVAADYAQSSANISSVFAAGVSSAYMRFGNFSSLTSGKVYLARNGDMFINVSAEL